MSTVIEVDWDAIADEGEHEEEVVPLRCRRCNFTFYIARLQEQIWCCYCGEKDEPDYHGAQNLDEDDE